MTSTLSNDFTLNESPLNNRAASKVHNRIKQIEQTITSHIIFSASDMAEYDVLMLDLFICATKIKAD